jgi:hypothetical protein
MFDRQSFGDLVLAIALVLPTAAMAKSESVARQPQAVAGSSAMAKAAIVDRTMSERGVSLLG